jgi:hypothetical protein
MELANNSAFANEGGGASFRMSRETAYLIQAYLSAEELGAARHPKLPTAVNYALGHLDQWSGTETADFMQPFMVGLTCEALIRYQKKTGDQRVLPAVQRTLAWLWNKAWVAEAQAFRYIICKPGADAGGNDCVNGSKPASDLNMLIAPAYGWVYAETGDAQFREWGDLIFSGGARGAYLAQGKQFSQNYRWSFDYVKYREE